MIMFFSIILFNIFILIKQILQKISKIYLYNPSAILI